MDLSKLRKEKNMTQQEVADYLGINRSVLSLIENREREMTPLVLFKLSRLYNISPEQLYGFSPEEEAENNFYRDFEKLDAEVLEKMLDFRSWIEDILLLEELIHDKK